MVWTSFRHASFVPETVSNCLPAGLAVMGQLQGLLRWANDRYCIDVLTQTQAASWPPAVHRLHEARVRSWPEQPSEGGSPILLSPELKAFRQTAAKWPARLAKG
jgi:hypothetical protein